MFIDLHSFVVIKEGGSRPDLAGRFGVVERIRILAHTGDPVVFVALFDPETGASPVYMFTPGDLQKRRQVKTSANMTRDHDTDHQAAIERMVA